MICDIEKSLWKSDFGTFWYKRRKARQIMYTGTATFVSMQDLSGSLKMLLSTVMTLLNMSILRKKKYYEYTT